MFSVVIPVYNHERYLTECVLSAVRSPLVEEVLLLDDGSRDASPALARRLSGGALGKVRDLTPPGRGNRGAHATLNELVAQAAGEWIAVLNSDDLFTPARFELIRRRMRYQSFDFCFGNVVVIDAQGRQLGGKRALYDPQLPFPDDFDVHAMVAQARWVPLLAHQNFIATTSNLVFRKELFTRIGGFSDLRYVHDWDFCLRAALIGTACYLPHALTAYRVHASNTIKEDSLKVDREVRTLFTRLLDDYPALRSNPEVTTSLAANRYLQEQDQPALSVVLPTDEGRHVYAEALQRAFTSLDLTDGEPCGRYRYAPSSVAEALSPLHLRNAMLALEMQDLDFVLVSHSLAEPPSTGTHGLRNALVFRPAAAPGGRIARLLPGGGEAGTLSTLFPGARLDRNSPRPVPLPTCLAHPGSSSKPTVFVMPALFAVGGVERLVIDMMRQLGSRYRFVVVTVEQLLESQGSLHGAAEGTALAFYDLAELAPPSLFLPMLERLRDIYQPALIWVPNGSPWQCDHAADIRRIFSDIPIVDQQAYDTTAGWIQRYHDPGIRSYDRFIAINRKIERTMIDTYGIAPGKIDMIYHSVNLSALGPAERTAEQCAEYRRLLALPQAGTLLGWVGRFTPQKRPLEFLHFAQAASKSRPDCHFVMIGDGELGPACDRFLADNALTNVTRIRFSNRMGEIYSLLDGLVSASEYEGLPISMLEALAMGVPVYSTDVGDVELVLTEYDAGVVTPAEWSLPQYLTGFERWLANREAFAQRARQAAPLVRARFGSVAVAREYEKCWEKAWNQCGKCYTGEFKTA